MTTSLFLFLAFHVRGVVVDPAARPVEGAKVACGTETVNTDSRGQFEFAAPANCEATVTKDGFAQQSVHLDESKDAQITLAIAPTSDRVVVTATGAPVPIEEAGVSASVFTSADFSMRQNPSVADYLRSVPGLNIVQTGNNGGVTSLFSRGGDSSSTLVLLDGIPLTEPGGYIDIVHLTTAGIDRIEDIRGPESALFGAEASSGVIQLFTHRGDPDSTTPHGSFTYERGSFSTDHWNASLDGGLFKRIDYSFTADQFRTTGQGPNDAYRITTGSANIGYRFSDRTSIHAIFREFDSYTGVPGQVYYGLFDYLAQETARDSAIGIHLDDARTSHFVQRANFSYHRKSDNYTDPTGEIDYSIAALLRVVPATPVPFVYLVSLVPASTTVAPPGLTLEQTVSSVFGGDDLSVTDRTDAGYQGTWTHTGGALVFGYQYERQAGLISGTNVARTDNGVFVHEQYAITKRIFAAVGARFEQSSAFGSKFTPRGSITFRLPTETFLRFSAARGITEPSLLENFANNPYYVGNPALRPEKTNSYEAGIYREWFRRRLRTDVAFFRNSFTDLIQFDSSVNPGTWQNIESSWARGGEASGTVRLTKYAAVRAAYTKLFTRITVSNAGDVGQQLLRQPKNSGSISLELTPRHFALIAGARFVGERQDEDFVFGVNRAQGYEYVFISGSWQATKHVTPFIRIENALDELYQEALGYSSLTRAAYGGVKLRW
jgi:outer membrane cobalamin receptor